MAFTCGSSLSQISCIFLISADGRSLNTFVHIFFKPSEAICLPVRKKKQKYVKLNGLIFDMKNKVLNLKNKIKTLTYK